MSPELTPSRTRPPCAPSARRACQGRVIRIHGLISIVQTEDGQTFPCHVRRLLKSLAIEGRNVVTVGDRVWFRPAAPGGDEGLIEKVQARRGVITREYRHRQHVIAANVDTVLIVAALAAPPSSSTSSIATWSHPRSAASGRSSCSTRPTWWTSPSTSG